MGPRISFRQMLLLQTEVGPRAQVWHQELFEVGNAHPKGSEIRILEENNFFIIYWFFLKTDLLDFKKKKGCFLSAVALNHPVFVQVLPLTFTCVPLPLPAPNHLPRRA